MQARYSPLTLRRYLTEAGGEKAPEDTDEDRQRYPDAFRPLVRAHPITGRKALHFSIEEIVSIDGMNREETYALLSGLIEHMTHTPHVIYRHDWSVGDVLLWDNRCLIHSVSEYNYAGQRRLMHQITGRDFPSAA
jgi:taurine dioxygenase